MISDGRSNDKEKNYLTRSNCLFRIIFQYKLSCYSISFSPLPFSKQRNIAVYFEENKLILTNEHVCDLNIP